jgi:hypothetical protein
MPVPQHEDIFCKENLQVWKKFPGWEGGLAPAQDRMPFNVEFTIQAAHM